MTVVCPVCGDTNGIIIGPYRHTHPAFDGLRRAACTACDMGFASPMPGAESLDAYNAGYFVNAHGGAATHPVVVAFHSAINRLRSAYVERFLGQHEIHVTNVLEIGPGGAYFACHWLKNHPGTTYHAIESDVSCHPKLHQLGIHVASGPHEIAGEAPMDLVVLSHVLEHVADPAGFLVAMTARLRSGGVLFIEVPCRDWEHKEQDEPHLLFFDKVPMSRLLEHLGFRQVQTTYHGETIEALRLRLSQRRFVRRFARLARSWLISRRILAPFASAQGLEPVETPLERAVVKPFEAHREQSLPSWWLRAIAVKR